MSLFLQMILPVPIGFLLDLLLGDPAWPLHPVRILGQLISGMEKIIRSCFPKTRRGEQIGGFLMTVLVCVFSTLLPVVVFLLLYRYAWGVGFLLECIVCYQLLAVRSLRKESARVQDALEKKDLNEARSAVSRIVGRDTDALDETGVTKAAVETVAENTCDGVIAPLFYMMIGGAALGLLYKAINTMDSMVGYQNDRYRYFGSAAAHLDDAANFIPARLAALFMLLAGGGLKMDVKNGWKIYRRDGRKHKSPNAAQSESVMAGLLQVQLAGDARYFGQLYKKPVIGDPIRQIQKNDIYEAGRVLYGSAWIGLLLFTGIKILIILLL